MVLRILYVVATIVASALAVGRGEVEVLGGDAYTERLGPLGECEAEVIRNSVDSKEKGGQNSDGQVIGEPEAIVASTLDVARGENKLLDADRHMDRLGPLGECEVAPTGRGMENKAREEKIENNHISDKQVPDSPEFHHDFHHDLFREPEQLHVALGSDLVCSIHLAEKNSFKGGLIECNVLGGKNTVPLPAPIASKRFVQLSCQGPRCCGLEQNRGKPWCWNDRGKLLLSPQATP